MTVTAGAAAAGGLRLDAAGDGKDSLAEDPMFSCELGGSGASLLGTGVESFVEGFGLGRELALVVSFRCGSGETFCDSGEDAGAPPGEDFWKKEKMERCLVLDEEAEPAPGLGPEPFAGVRAVPALLSPAMVGAARLVTNSRRVIGWYWVKYCGNTIWARGCGCGEKEEQMKKRYMDGMGE